MALFLDACETRREAFPDISFRHFISAEEILFAFPLFPNPLCSLVLTFLFCNINMNKAIQ